MTLTAPDNKILVEGNPVVIEYKTNSGNILPGDSVYISGTGVVSEGGASTGTQSSAIGVVGYEQASDKYKPSDETTTYGNGVLAPVLMAGSGTIVQARTAAGISVGDFLCPTSTSSGDLTAATVGTDHVLAIALEASTSAGLSMVVLL